MHEKNIVYRRLIHKFRQRRFSDIHRGGLLLVVFSVALSSNRILQTKHIIYFLIRGHARMIGNKKYGLFFKDFILNKYFLQFLKSS